MNPQKQEEWDRVYLPEFWQEKFFFEHFWQAARKAKGLAEAYGEEAKVNKTADGWVVVPGSAMIAIMKRRRDIPDVWNSSLGNKSGPPTASEKSELPTYEATDEDESE